MLIRQMKTDQFGTDYLTIIMASSLVQAPRIAHSALVKQSPLFASLPSRLLKEMADHFHLVHWRKGSFVNPELLLTRFYFLQSGQLEMKRTDPEQGREVTLDMLYPGDSFDIITLLDGEPHDVMICPLTELQLISLPMEMMRQWLWTYPELNKQFLPYLAQKIREREEQAACFALHDVTTRLSRVILKHLNKIQTYTGEPEHAHQEHLISNLSDEALARMTGSVRQVVNKQLQFWKKKGILQKKRNQIVINDLEAIYEAAHQAEKSHK